MPACLNHGYTGGKTFTNKNYEIPENSGNTLEKSIHLWYNHQGYNFID